MLVVKRSAGSAYRHVVLAFDFSARRGGGIQGVVGRGYPARVVLDAAEKRGADLIAVGKRGRSGLERLLIGSLTRHVLGESRCDVLVARR